MSDYLIEGASEEGGGRVQVPLRTHVERILDDMPDLPDDAREAIGFWAENIFDNTHARAVGYEEYLDSNSSLSQLWGAAAQLEAMLEVADEAGRELRDDELAAIRAGFMRAASSRQERGYAGEQHIEVLADHIPRMAAVIRRLNGR